MRGLRTTIGLVVVLGGLFAYIYFVTWKQPEGGRRIETGESVRGARCRQDRASFG